MMPNLRRLADLLGGEVRGGSVLCPGPGHSNADRSLSVTPGSSLPDGFLVHSFAGDDPLQSKDYIRGKLGIERERKVNGKAAARTARAIERVYDYTDEKGKLLYQAVRYSPKGFSQRKPDGKGGWIASVKDVRKVPYRLPQLLAAEDGPVLIVEGEKDADNVARLGFAATTNVGGAGKWHASLGKFLRGADVVIIPHNDAPGRDHTLDVARKLDGIAASVRILDLARHWSAMPEKGDVSDWIAAGHTADELGKLIDQAPVFDPAVMEAPPIAPNAPPHFVLVPFNLITWTSAIEYLVDDILPIKGLVLIYGAPKCGKSFWTFDLVMHVARGIDYRDKQVEPGTIVYLAAEGGLGFIKRVEAYRLKHDCQDARFHLCTVRPNLAADAQAMIESIRAQLGAEVPAAIVVDTVNRTLVGSENKPDDMAQYLRAAAILEDEFKCCIVLVHHCGVEAGRPRGHTSLTAAADVQVRVEKNGANVVAEVELAKDGPSDDQFVSRLDIVVVGKNKKGRDVTSCVIIPVDATKVLASKPKEPKLTPNQKTMFAILHKAGSRGLDTEEWNDQAREAGIGTKRRADLVDIREALKAKKLVREFAGRWTVDNGSD